MKKEISSHFDQLIKLGFSKSEKKEGKTQSIVYANGIKEYLISWDKTSIKPSLTYSDSENLLGILDCESEIRNIYSHLHEDLNQALAWIMAVMPVEEYYTIFINKTLNLADGKD